ncbi:MAG: Mur ligase family protein, partial [Flavobacteriaceae bacterium]|nr:Mur ligase family protein [Flavobacteriaceae bacterium]
AVLEKHKRLVLKDTANLSTGGTATDVTEIVHPANVAMAERISKIIDLDICGIDVMTTDITRPLSDTNGAVLEVNAGPGFRMHLHPAIGLPSNVAAPVIDALFPKKDDTGRIPIVAITGTNGKTTTTRLMAHIAKMKGYRVGYTTSDGVYIQNRLLMRGDCTGPNSTEFVLKDPTVNFAVLECARGGLLRSGLGFGSCDVGIVTNVSADHLGLSGINDLQQMARVKSVIPETVVDDGYAILNADDDLVYAMGRNLDCHVALFSMDENNPRIKELQQINGVTAVFENGYVTICRGEWKMRIMKAENIPLTFGGKADFMIQNILAAVLAAHVQGINLEDIKAALETFGPSPSQTPGRLNLFEFKNFSVLLDYAHNPSGMIALQKFLDNLEYKYRVGIIAGIGDRREEDNNEIGSVAAEMFDEIIIRQDKHLRGKTEEELIEMIKVGIMKKNPDIPVHVIPKESEAIEFAINNVIPGTLIVLCSDVVTEALELVQNLKEKSINQPTEVAN